MGSLYDPSWSLAHRFLSTDLATEYDGLVFVEESTATTLLDDTDQTPTSTTSTDG